MERLDNCIVKVAINKLDDGKRKYETMRRRDCLKKDVDFENLVEEKLEKMELNNRRSQ